MLGRRRKRILKLISDVDDHFIRKMIKESLGEQDDRLRIKKLIGRFGGIPGIGLAFASVILIFTFSFPRTSIFFSRCCYEVVGTRAFQTGSQVASRLLALSSRRYRRSVHHRLEKFLLKLMKDRESPRTTFYEAFNALLNEHEKGE